LPKCRANSAKWCSICSDFGNHMVLCAGCRVGICTTTATVLTGCMNWSAIIEEDDFVFFCPFCARSKKVACQVCPVHHLFTSEFDLVLLAFPRSGTTTHFRHMVSLRSPGAPDRGNVPRERGSIHTFSPP
jgi:hypothetical protein